MVTSLGRSQSATTSTTTYSAHGKSTCRVAIYARYSSDLQNASLIDDQNRVCGALAERNGAQLAALRFFGHNCNRYSNRRGRLGSTLLWPRPWIVYRGIR